MAKFKNKIISSSLVGVMFLGTISGVVISQDKKVKVVYADSKAAQNARAKITHLTNSLKGSYLGIKNQATWEGYIKEAKTFIANMPKSENSLKITLTTEVDRYQALVNALARINQVEKSTAPKDKGGYGNYLGIKNAETWNEYLRLAKIDLGKVDQNIFKDQYEELVNRMNSISVLVQDIESDYLVKYNEVKTLFNEAKMNYDSSKAEEALRAANNLGSCNRTTALVKELMVYLNLVDPYDGGTVTRNKVLAEAKKQCDSPNTRYSQANRGKTINGLTYWDCSSFTVNAYKAGGLSISGTSNDQYEAVKKTGKIISENELIPGDLVFWISEETNKVTHVAIYAGNGEVYAARSSERPDEEQVSQHYLYGDPVFGRPNVLVNSDNKENK